MALSDEIIEAELFTEVTVLNESAFIDRYAGILGLKDNVALALSIGEVEVLTVTPDTFEGRLRGDELFRAAYRRVGFHNLADEMALPLPPKPPMSHEEVNDLAERIRTIRSKQEIYKQLGLCHKIGHNVLLLLGRESFAVTDQDTWLARLPDVIKISAEGTGIQEIIINSDKIDPQLSL